MASEFQLYKILCDIEELERLNQLLKETLERRFAPDPVVDELLESARATLELLKNRIRQ